MKKFISVLVLVCIMASMFTLSAFADGAFFIHSDDKDTEKNMYWIYTSGTYGTSDYREGFTINISPVSGTVLANDGEKIVVEYYNGSTRLCTSTYKGGYPVNNMLSCNTVWLGKASSSWDTVWENSISSTILPNKAVVTIGSTTETFEGVGAKGGSVDNFVMNTMPITVKNGNVVVGYYDTLAEAVKNAPSGAVIELKDGNHDFAATGGNGKNLTIIGASRSGTIINFAAAEYSTYGDLVFKNLTVNEDNSNYTGFTHTTSLTYDNCDINGQLFNHGASTLNCTNCTFTQTSSDAYNVWTYAASTANFSNCTFNSKGKAVLVYNEGYTDTTVNMSACTLNDGGNPIADKAAIELDSAFHAIKLNLDSATKANGFGQDTVCGNNLWNEKIHKYYDATKEDKQGGQATVYSNGVQIYPVLPEAKPVVNNPYGVPSTADNSNMPLWAVLFIGFAAVALLTGKKRRA